MRLHRLARAALLVGLCFSACKHEAPDSPQYEEAFQLYTRLYSAKLDDSYGDPQMQRVLSLLGQVDPASSRAAEAQDLKAKVEQGVADYQKRQEKVAADERAAEAPANWPAGPGEAPAPSPLPPVPGVTGPALGMSRDDFLSKFGGCFELRGVYQQEGKQGEAYAVKDACAKRYAALASSFVIILDGHVMRELPLSDAVVVDGGPAAAPPPPPPAPAPPPPPPPPQPLKWLPGAPRAAVPAP